MQRRQIKNLILGASAILILTSLFLEAFSKLRVFSRIGQLAEEPQGRPHQLAGHIRDAEGWFYFAICCAVGGTLLAAFNTTESGRRPWWFRGPATVALVFWPFLSLLYFIGLPYPIVGVGYAVCFGVLLMRRSGVKQQLLEPTEIEQDTVD